MTRYLLTIVAWGLVSYSSFGQQTCTSGLERAEDLYDQGRLLDILDRQTSRKFWECLENGDFSQEEMVRAHKLLTLVYIFTDNEAAADESMINLLVTEPEHDLELGDPTEIKVLMNKFRTWPIFRIEGKIGAVYGTPSISNAYSPFTADASEKTTTSILGFSLEANVTRHIANGFEVGSGVQLRRTAHRVEYDLSNQSGLQLTIDDAQSYFRFPLFVRYNFNYDKRDEITNERVPYNFYVFGGTALDYLWTATYINESRTGGISTTLDENDLKAFNQVNELTTSVFAGFGVKARFNRVNFFFAEVRFDYALSLYNNPQEKFSNPELYSDLAYVPDDLRINVLSFSLGYIHSIYSPKKIKP